jgi:hypothetical protein
MTIVKRRVLTKKAAEAAVSVRLTGLTIGCSSLSDAPTPTLYKLRDGMPNSTPALNAVEGFGPSWVGFKSKQDKRQQ